MYFGTAIELDTTPIPSYQFITALIRDVFGSYFVEETIWKNQDGYALISRTYFRDRKRFPCAINDKTEANIQLLYINALHGQTRYDPAIIAQRFTQSVKKHFRINVDFLLYFEDDTSVLREAKGQMIYHLVRLLLEQIKGTESIPAWKLDTWREDGPMNKMCSYLLSIAKNTYTEQVLNNLHLTDPT